MRTFGSDSGSSEVGFVLVCQHRQSQSVAMAEGYTNPFKGRIASVSAPMRVLLTKPGGHWAEIREHRVTTFRAIEYIVFVDGSLLESELFHKGREAEYPKALEARIKQFLDGGWVEQPEGRSKRRLKNVEF